MPTRFLNEAEKKSGQKDVFWAEIFNGVATNFLGESLVFLLAVHFGAGNVVLGFISSGIFVSGLVAPFLVKIFVGKNQEKSHALIWNLRGLFSLGYVALFFLKGKAAVAVLVATYSMFCICRTMGVVFNDLTSKNISSTQNRGFVISKINTAYQFSSLFAKVASTIVTGIKAIPALTGIIGLQVFGVVANVFSAFFYGKIPCRRVVEDAHVPFLKVMKDAFKDKGTSHLIWLRAIFLSETIGVGMSIPFMSKVLGLNNYMVMSYSVLTVIGMMLASIMMRIFSDKIGARPIILIISMILNIVLVVWIILPPTVSFFVFFILGFLANFLSHGINLMASKMVALVIPEDNSVGFNSFVNFMIAICALVTGIVSGHLIDWGTLVKTSLTMQGFKLFNPYSLCFLLPLILSIIGRVLTLTTNEHGALSATQAVQTIFSMHGLRAFSIIEKIEKTKDPLKRKILLMALGTNLTNVATSEIRMKLASPFSSDKVEMIRALVDCPRPALVSDLAKLALDDDSYVQLDAIGALGGYVDDPVAHDALVSLLDCKWSSSRSMASKSLSRFSDAAVYLDKINKLSLAARHIDEEIDYLVAKRNMDKEGTFYRDFFISVKRMHSPIYRQTRYALLASFLKFGSPRLAHLYELMNSGTVVDFLEDFLPEARDLEEIDSHFVEVFNAFEENNKPFIIDFCIQMVRNSNVSSNSCFENLKAGLLKAERMDINGFDIQDMLALLYFGYSLRKVSEK